MRGRTALAALLLAALACAGSEASAPAAPQPSGEPGELLDCSVEYGALPTAESYVVAINDVAGSYMAAKRLHDRLRTDPGVPSKEVDEAWRARVAAAQTLVRACHCWEQLDRVAYTEQVLAARDTTTRRLKEKIGKTVAGPCQKVFEAEAADR